MKATEQRCFVVSTLTHVALLLLIVLTPALATKRDNRDLTRDEMVMTIVPQTKLTETKVQQGGNPESTATPPPMKVEPLPPPVEPAKPEFKPEQDFTPPQPKDELKPRPEKHVKISEKVVHPEDPPPPDDTPKIKVKKPKADETKDLDVEKPSRTIRLAEAIKRGARDDTALKTAQADAEAKAAVEQERRDRLAAENARKKWQAVLSGASTSLATKFAPSTQIDMPGPEREAFAPYFLYLHNLYDANWKRPQAIAQSLASVHAEITIERDGTLKDFRILTPSGVREMDESVREVLSRYRRLRPLPPECADPEKIFTIRFSLTADSPT
jgi:TonB family protein